MRVFHSVDFTLVETVAQAKCKSTEFGGEKYLR